MKNNTLSPANSSQFCAIPHNLRIIARKRILIENPTPDFKMFQTPREQKTNNINFLLINEFQNLTNYFYKIKSP